MKHIFTNLGIDGTDKIGVKLYIVGATLLFSPTTSLFLLTKAEINKVLHRDVAQFDPSLGLFDLICN